MSYEVESRERILDQLRQIVQTNMNSEPVQVYLFGSWARHEEKRSSDIDLAINSLSPLSTSKWNRLIEDIEESTIPYTVDIVDLAHANPILVQQVKEEGILWKDYTTG
ncbi:putative nucleotidyltransferase [Jeotgalibacillus alimentarius]|uniref:Putative nucleotidyltransferase n=1 Tax=Jeotgalibacillus alimentarius TaxID=135826 RepID=A0A0C2V305_9BACL|nr:nucleotidyltransferase domain-containing protein [Jeotgalibacillus alimentarius]KIL43427.1 putative nucleotidyltransferase [Jeotgalibacillus alimentarius]